MPADSAKAPQADGLNVNLGGERRDEPREDKADECAGREKDDEDRCERGGERGGHHRLDVRSVKEIVQVGGRANSVGRSPS